MSHSSTLIHSQAAALAQAYVIRWPVRDLERLLGEVAATLGAQLERQDGSQGSDRDEPAAPGRSRTPMGGSMQQGPLRGQAANRTDGQQTLGHDQLSEQEERSFYVLTRLRNGDQLHGKYRRTRIAAAVTQPAWRGKRGRAAPLTSPPTLMSLNFSAKCMF